MRLPTRRSDDADVIRARLRALLADSDDRGGWLPDESDFCPADRSDAGDPERIPPPGSLRASPSTRIAGRTPPDAVPEPDDEQSGLPPGLGRHRAPGVTARWNPGSRGSRALWVAALVAALVIVGWTWMDRPQIEPVTGGAAATEPALSSSARAAPSVGEVAQTSSTVVVSVVGLVVRPGLVTVPNGSRVADAVAAAGGLLPEADPATVNLAAVVSDGQQIAVGMPGAGSGTGGSGTPDAGDGGPVDLNAASAAQLDALPGIGPVLARRIVDHRTREGPFRSVDELDDVPGIGPAIFAALSELVAV